MRRVEKSQNLFNKAHKILFYLERDLHQYLDNLLIILKNYGSSPTF